MKETLRYWRHFYVNRLNIIYVLYAVVAVYLVVDLRYILVALQPQWQLIGVLLLLLIIDAKTFLENAHMIMITGILSAIFIFIGGLLSVFPVVQAIFLFIIIFCSMWLSASKQILNLPTFIVILLTLIVSMTPLNVIENPHRAMSLILSLVIIQLMHLLFIYKYQYYTRTAYQKIAIKRLKTLNDEVFCTFLANDYKEQLYLYERRIHVAKNAYLQAVAKINSDGQQNDLAQNFINTYFALIAVSMIRKQVSDYSVFLLCHHEIESLKDNLDSIYCAGQDKKQVLSGVKKVTQSIDAFEAITERVLEISSKEPIVFYLFIQNLQNYQQKLRTLFLKHIGDG